MENQTITVPSIQSFATALAPHKQDLRKSNVQEYRERINPEKTNNSDDLFAFDSEEPEQNNNNINSDRIGIEPTQNGPDSQLEQEYLPKKPIIDHLEKLKIQNEEKQKKYKQYALDLKVKYKKYETESQQKYEKYMDKTKQQTNILFTQKEDMFYQLKI